MTGNKRIKVGSSIIINDTTGKFAAIIHTVGWKSLGKEEQVFSQSAWVDSQEEAMRLGSEALNKGMAQLKASGLKTYREN